MEPEIRVVLDHTALTSYAELKGVGVAELIAMIEEDDGASLVGIPAAHYMSAHRQLEGEDRARLVDLATRPEVVTVILPLNGGDAPEAAELGHIMGQAVLEVRRRPGTYLATFDAHEARRHLPADGVLDLAGEF
jgi:hypothetical protein